MNVQHGGLQLNGGIIYVGEGGHQQVIPQLEVPQEGGLLQGSFQQGGILVGGPHLLLDRTRRWCELCKVFFNLGDSIVSCVSAIPFPSSPPLFVMLNR